jgi:Cyclin-dependent kinase inhibitor 3 (CDKN3)
MNSFPGAPTHPLPHSLEQAYWVSPGKLMAGSYPGADDPMTSGLKLKALIDCGIRHVVNLMEPDEIDRFGRPFRPYEAEMRSLVPATDLGVTFRRIPIRDMRVPARRHMILILDDIDRALAENRPAYVHCLGGLGRTGMVVGCYLARLALASGRGVLDLLSALRRNTATGNLASPQTDSQVELVLSWVEGE